MKTRYPEECLAFEVTREPEGGEIHKGDHVEGAGVCCNGACGNALVAK